MIQGICCHHHHFYYLINFLTTAMPIPVVALPAASSCIALTAKQVAIHVATTENAYAVTSASLAYALTRFAYHYMIPKWIQQDVAVKDFMKPPSQRSIPSDADDHHDEHELTNLSSIIEKLQALAMNASHNMTTNEIQSIPYTNAALLLYIQLIIQIRTLQNKRVGPTIYPISFPCRSSKVDRTIPLFPHESSTVLGESSTTLEKKAHIKQPDEKAAMRHQFEYEAMCSNSDCPYSILQLLDFAILAHENDVNRLREQLNERYGQDVMTIIQHQVNDTQWDRRPGCIGHYIAVYHTTKTMIIGIKGTSTLEDLLLDCCGRAITYIRQLDVMDASEETRIEVFARQSHPIILEDGVYGSSHHQISGDQKPQSFLKENEIQNHGSSSNHHEEVGVEVLCEHERIWIEQENITSIDDEYNMNPYFVIGLHQNHQESNCIRCHEGILIATKRLANKVQKKVEYYVLENNYQLIICGHSLGAGAAALLGIVLRERLPSLKSYQSTTDCTSPSVSSSCRHPNTIPTDSTLQQQRQKERIRVYAFAPPPVVDYDTSISSSSYITSFVNDCDIIPRCSLANLLVFIDVLNNTIYHRMNNRGFIPDTVSGTISFIQKLSKGSNDPDLLFSYDEIQLAIVSAMNKLQVRHRDHLFIPGKVIYMMSADHDHMSSSLDCHENNHGRSAFSSSSKRNDEEVNDATTNWEDKHDIQPTPTNTQPENMKGSKNNSNLEDNNTAHTNIQWMVTDCSDSALRFFTLDSFQFMTDHLTSSYETTIQTLINFK